MNYSNRIGIVTYWESNDNYGQQLQGWAMQRYLRAHGESPFLIRCTMQSDYYKRSLLKRIKKYIKEAILWLVQYTIIGHSHELRKFCIRVYGIDIVQRRFNVFRNREMAMTKVYKSYKSLLNDPPKADVYIAGSDQIWSDVLPLDWWEIAYLQFGDVNTKRIAYAPSMPHPNPSEEQVQILKKYLSIFSAISTRESSSTEYLRSLGFESTVVLDPTLLLDADDYRRLCFNTKADSSIFVYSINYTDEKEIPMDAIKKYASRQGVDVVVTPSCGYIPYTEMFEGVRYEYATIPEWLKRIDKAQLVVTPSFHGVVFAILMHRPFMFTPLIGKYAKGNERITELLEKLNLSACVWNGKRKIEEYANMKVDWDDVSERMKVIREQSKIYLSRALGKN